MAGEAEAINSIVQAYRHTPVYSDIKEWVTPKRRALALLWAVTLESGRYKQARRVLRTADNRCCCFGVLCDILDPKGWTPKADTIQGDQHVYRHRGDTQMPSDKVMDIFEGRTFNYAPMNDKGATFLHIAACIRQDFGLPPREA